MTPVDPGRRVSETPQLDRLRRYAADRNLKVTTGNATQREPDYFVGLSGDLKNWSPTIISRTSLDSVEAAAAYLLNTLERLGAL